VQRKVGPEVVLRLIGGALRLDAETFRQAVAPETPTRPHLALVALAAVSSGFAYAMEAVTRGLLQESDFALYRLLVLIGMAETLIEFLLFVVVVYLMRRIARRPAPGFVALCRLFALGLAPVCLVFLGPIIGYPDWIRGALVLWRIVICVVGLKVATEGSWIVAALTVLAGDFISSPVVNLLLFGVTGQPPPSGSLPT
jgi:hypothetical protein